MAITASTRWPICGISVPAPAAPARTAPPPRQPEAANPFQMFKPVLKMLGAEPVGNYAIRINWNDGHNTGIYSWDHFRRICPCPECQAEILP